jgi:hypothetical protein
MTKFVPDLLVVIALITFTYLAFRWRSDDFFRGRFWILLTGTLVVIVHIPEEQRSRETYLTSASAGSFTFGYSYNILNERTKVVYPAITDAGLTVSPSETLTTKVESGAQGTVRNFV